MPPIAKPREHVLALVKDMLTLGFAPREVDSQHSG